MYVRYILFLVVGFKKKRLPTSTFDNYLPVVCWSPYFATVLEAWAQKSHPNMLFLFYEDMKKVIILFAPAPSIRFWFIYLLM